MIDLEDLRRAYEGTTPGEWTTNHEDYGEEWYLGGEGAGQCWVNTDHSSIIYGGHDLSDATFIATAHNQWPAIMDELSELRAENERLQKWLAAAEEAASRLANGEDPCSVCSWRTGECRHPASCPDNHYHNFFWSAAKEQEASHEVQ